MERPNGRNDGHNDDHRTNRVRHVTLPIKSGCDVLLRVAGGMRTLSLQS